MSADAPVVPLQPDDALSTEDAIHLEIADGPEEKARMARNDAAAWEREAALADAPMAARLLLHAGRVLEGTGDRQAASALFTRALEKDPEYRPALDGLRWIAADSGDWKRVAQLFKDELPFAKNAPARFELLRARAAVHAQRLNDKEGAAAVLAEALSIAPEHPSLLASAIVEAAQKGDHARELSLHQRLAHGVRDERLKARHLALSARLQDRQGDATGAAATRAELLKLEPTDLIAQASTLPSLQRAGDVAALEKIARAEMEASSGSSARYRLARLIADRRQAYDEALELLQTAREINPRDSLALEALIDVSERKGDGAAVATHLRQRLETARDPADRCVAALRLARLTESEGRLAEARALYATALEQVPDQLEAKAAGARLSAPGEAVDELVTAESRLAAAVDPKQRAAALHRVAAMAEDRADEAKSLAMLREAHALDRTDRGAWLGIVRLLERARSAPALASFHHENYLATVYPAAKREALLAEAEILETRVKDPAAAAALYRAALELRQEGEAARGLVRCATATGSTDDLALGLEHALAPCAPVTLTGSLAVLVRAAELQLIERASPTEAARRYRRVVELDATNAVARRVLRRLFLQTGDEAAAAELAEAPGPSDGDDSLATATEAARKALLARQPGEAAEALAQITAAVPAHRTAWAELARVEEQRGRFAEASAALERHAQLLSDAMSKADSFYRAAEIAEDRALDVPRARALGETAVTAYPRQAAAWKLVARLALAMGDLPRAMSALEQEAVVTQLKDRTTAQRRLARLLADFTGDRERATQLLKDIVEADGGDLAAIADLERLLHDSGDLVRSAELRGKLASRCADMRAAAALRTSAAEDRARAGDVEGAINEFRRALALDGRNRAAAEEVIFALRTKGDRAGLAEMYQRMTPYFDNDTQAVLLQMRGELAEADGNPALAVRCFRDAIAADARLLPAMRDARRLHEAAGEWNEARALLAQEGEGHVDPIEGVHLIVRAGEVAEKLREVEQAEAHYLRALEKSPGEPRAMGRLDALLRPQGRFSELVTIYEREGEAATQDAKRSAELYAEGAWLRFEKLGEERRASVPLNRALARDATCSRALELKAAIAVAENRGQDAEDALSTALAAASAAARPRLLARLAEARLTLGQFPAALEAAQAASGAAPENLDFMELVARAALRSKALPVAIATAEKLVGLAQDRVNGAKYAKLAGSVRRLAGDIPNASAQYRRALEFLPGDKEALEGLEATHLETGDFDGLASAYETLATASAGDPAGTLGYLSKAASVWERAHAPLRAAGVYKTALKADPTSAPLRLALARTLAASPLMRVEAASALRTLVARDACLPDSYRALVELFDAENRKDAAFVATACLVSLGRATAGELARYGELAGKLPPGPTGAIGLEDQELLVHPAERASPVRELFAALWEPLTKVIAGNVDARGLGRSDRIKGDLRSAADRFAKIFGVPEFELMQSARDAQQAWIENTEPPTIILGTQRMQGGVGPLFFALGMLLGRVRQRNQVALFAQPIEVANLVADSLRVVDPGFSRFGTKNDELLRLITKAVGRSERKALEALLPKFAGPVNFAAYTQAMAFTGHRFGLATAGDPAAAVAAIGNGQTDRPDVKELLAFAVSEEYLTLRQKLKIALA